MSSTLTRLDQKIAEHNEKARDAEEKARERRAELVGDSAPEPGTDEFKAMVDEADGLFATLDAERDKVEELKAQRKTLARTLGVPTDPGTGEPRGDNPEELAAAVASALAGKSAPSPDQVALGRRIVESDGYKALQDSGVLTSSAGIGGTVALGKAMSKTEFKTLISGGSTSAGAFKEPDIQPYLGLLQRPIVLTQMVQTIPVSTDSVKYVQQLTAGHNVEIIPDPITADAIGSGSPAVTAADAGLKPESEYTFTTKTADVETLAHFLPVHKNQFADVPQLEGIIDAEMRYGLLKFLEGEIAAGNGSTGHLRGILNTTGIVDQTIGADSVIVALHKALTGIRLGFIEPTLIVMHPSDWEAIRLMRSSVAMTDPGDPGGTPVVPPTVVDTGEFMFGPPSQAGASTLWGLPVRITPVVPAGSPIIGDFSQAQLYLREGITVNASDSHADFFRRNLIALLAEMRAGFGVRRPQAFGTISV
ncbi:MAG: phage major capsid protein [Solirubrobacteraceae bacterium]|nr:phage major capsid protein [Solirubrobacteraceae bacterium]